MGSRALPISQPHATSFRSWPLEKPSEQLESGRAILEDHNLISDLLRVGADRRGLQNGIFWILRAPCPSSLPPPLELVGALPCRGAVVCSCRARGRRAPAGGREQRTAVGRTCMREQTGSSVSFGLLPVELADGPLPLELVGTLPCQESRGLLLPSQRAAGSCRQTRPEHRGRLIFARAARILWVLRHPCRWSLLRACSRWSPSGPTPCRESRGLLQLSQRAAGSCRRMRPENRSHLISARALRGLSTLFSSES